MTHEIRDQQRARIQRARDVTGLTTTEIARRGKLSPSTLNNFMNRDVTHNLSTSTITKLDTAVTLIVHEHSKTPEEAQRKLAYYAGTTAPPTLEPTNINAINIQIHGSVQAGHWAEAVELQPYERETITIPRPDGHETYFGLTVKGQSMNREYPEGTILICVPIWDYDHPIESGDHVIVHRHDGGGMTEATVKEFVLDDLGRYWLWPRSTDPEFQQPIEIKHEQLTAQDCACTADVQITAIVVADFRVRNRRHK